MACLAASGSENHFAWDFSSQVVPWEGDMGLIPLSLHLPAYSVEVRQSGWRWQLSVNSETS